MSGSGFEIAQGHVTVTAEVDEQQVEQSTQGAGKKLAAWAGGLGLGALVTKGLVDNLDVAAANTKLKAQMGLTSETAANAGKAAGEVYRDGFGESIVDVNDAIKGVGQNMVDLNTLSKPQLKDLAQGALGIAKTFDVDVNDATKAAGQLMKTGLAKDGGEAMDIITKGFQMGLDRSGDWLDTLNEYSPQFKKIGIDGPTALSAINSFMQAGARDTDAAADAFKEFGLRAIDGSTGTVQAYKDLHLNAEKTGKAIASGGPAAQQAMQQVFSALQNVKDPVKQNQLGTALMGTQWEDTVRAILPKIDLTKNSVGEIAGSTKKMNDEMQSTPQEKIEQLKRQAEGLLGQAVQLPGPFGTLSAAVAGFGPSLIQMGGGLAMMLPAMIPLIASTWAWTAALLANPMTWIVIGIVALVAAIVLIATKTDWFQKLWTVCWEAIKGAASAAWDWLKDVIGKGFEFVKMLFLNFTGPGLIIKHWEDIKAATGAAWEWIKSSASKAWELIKTYIVNPVVQTKNEIVNAFNSVVDFIWGLGGRISSAASGMWGGISRAFKSAINTIIGGWNSLHFSVPGFHLGPIGFDGFSLGVPHIPYLAAGGTALTGGTAMVGERGPELIHLPKGASVVPLSNRGGDQGLGGIQNLNVHINGTLDFASAADRKKFAAQMAHEINEALRKYNRERV